MGLYVYQSSTRLVLLIAFLSQVLVSGCLPTTIPDAYVTQLSDGQVQVLVPLTSTPGTATTTSSRVSPTQTSIAMSNPTSSTTKFYNSLTGISPSTGANAATFQGLSSLAASLPTQSTQLDKADGTPPGKIHDISVHNTNNQVSMAHSSDRPFEAFHNPSSTTKGAPVIPIQGADDGTSSIDGRPLATKSSPTMVIPTISTVSSQGSSEIDYSVSKGFPSSVNPSHSELQTSSSLSATFTRGILTDSSSPTETAPFSETDGFLPMPLVSDVPVLASSIDAGAPTASIKKSTVGSPSKLTYPTPSTQLSVFNGPSPVGTRFSTPASITGASTIGTFGTAASMDGIADTSVTSLTGAPSNRKTTLPEISGPTQRTKITLGSSPLRSGPIFDVPTATWTTAPPDLKLEIVTDPAWTSDPLITTTLPGSDQPTLVPVFASCEGCGPGGSLVVLGAFKPLISYHLPNVPGFPPIPRFHLPCIAFCPSSGGPSPGGTPPKPGPPKREEEQKDDDDNKGEDKQDDETENQTDEQENEQDDDQDDDEDDDQDDDDEDDQDDDQDDQHSTASPTAETSSRPPCTAASSSGCTTQPSTTTGTSSGSSSSTGTSSPTGTGSPRITDTIYINERPTDVQVQDRDMEQYLIAACSSLGIADEQFDSTSIPMATTAMPTTSLGSVSTCALICAQLDRWQYAYRGLRSTQLGRWGSRGSPTRREPRFTQVSRCIWRYMGDPPRSGRLRRGGFLYARHLGKRVSQRKTPSFFTANYYTFVLYNS